jgi:uncharacterized protein (DUF433 family)
MPNPLVMPSHVFAIPDGFIYLAASFVDCYDRIMSKLEELENAAALLSPAEKAELIKSVAQDLGDTFAGIESNPSVCGGEPCIVRTRIPVWVLEQARRLGTSEAELLRAYPTLRAADLVNAWSYVRTHRDEIDRQIIDNEEVD